MQRFCDGFMLGANVSLRLRQVIRCPSLPFSQEQRRQRVETAQNARDALRCVEKSSVRARLPTMKAQKAVDEFNNNPLPVTELPALSAYPPGTGPISHLGSRHVRYGVRAHQVRSGDAQGALRASSSIFVHELAMCALVTLPDKSRQPLPCAR